ncbi:hypothetical protein [Singulisphaera sp. PoT]|uniref:hypothetical protein n=1 Tax=Singulisphaera sp. PoT TaxID=3411797 RepID=UPI003BF4837C
MSIVARSRREVKPARKTPVYSLALAIDHAVYMVESIPAGGFGSKAFRIVKKADGAVYDVVRTHDGLVACDCPDYEVRRKGITAECCKHGRALVAMGLLDAPTAVANAAAPAAEPCCPADEVEPCSACLHSSAPAVVAEVETVGTHGTPTPAELPAQVEATQPEVIEPTATAVEPVQADDEELPARPALLTLDELIESEAARLRRFETYAHDLMARTLAELARTVRSVQARSPLDLDDEAMPRRTASRPSPCLRKYPSPRPSMDLSDDFNCSLLVYWAYYFFSFISLLG